MGLYFDGDVIRPRTGSVKRESQSLTQRLDAAAAGPYVVSYPCTPSPPAVPSPSVSSSQYAVIPLSKYRGFKKLSQIKFRHFGVVGSIARPRLVLVGVWGNNSSKIHLKILPTCQHKENVIYHLPQG